METVMLETYDRTSEPLTPAQETEMKNVILRAVADHLEIKSMQTFGGMRHSLRLEIVIPEEN